MGLDIETYRMWENLASSQLDSFRIGQRHNLDVFEKAGFPIRLKSLSSMRPLLGAMQEGRFDNFMEDLGGMTPEELDVFTQACVHLIHFQHTIFPHNNPLVSLDVMISAFSVYSKMNDVAPGFRSVLELGPGCGYLSFFIKTVKNLSRYTQVEACESFYFLQHKINQYLFRENFISHLPIADVSSYESYYPDLPNSMQDVTHMRPLAIERKTEWRYEQYPWWNISKLKASDYAYDVVTSNANLLEFTTSALYDYLSLIKSRLAKDGVLFVQCFGYGGGMGRSIDGLWEAMREMKFAPLFVTSELCVDPKQFLEGIPKDVRDIFIFPAGLGGRLLASDPQVQARFDSITLVDRNPDKVLPDGVKGMVPEDVKPGAGKYGVITHKSESIIRDYAMVCERNSIPFTVLKSEPETKKLAVPYGVFVTEGHPLYERYQTDNFYASRFDGDVTPGITKAFFEQNAKRKKYSKEDVFQKIVEHLNQ